MTSTNNRLRGAVAERFGTIANFSRALNWSYRKTRDIITGRQVPTVYEARQMASALDVLRNPELFMTLFFADDNHNVVNAEASCVLLSRRRSNDQA